MTVPAEFPPFAVTVDLVVLTVAAGQLRVLLVQRGGEPYRGRWALPGGFVDIDEDLSDAAERELVEETGLAEPAGHLEQLRTYGAPGRDPRGRVVTVAYLALLPDLPRPVAGTDAVAARWRPVAGLAADELAFDQDRIVADGVERARSMLENTTLATAFCPPEFTVARLRGVYEAVWGVPLDPHDFCRRVASTPGFVVSAGGTAPAGQARLYRAGPAERLHPPLLRREP